VYKSCSYWCALAVAHETRDKGKIDGPHHWFALAGERLQTKISKNANRKLKKHEHE
jgi:hypothetical protein